MPESWKSILFIMLFPVLLMAAGVEKSGELNFAKAPGFANDSETPAGMLAARLSRNGVIIRWKPSPDRSTISGRADLMDALISADESLMVIIERVGGAEKLNVTRFILVNLYNGKICSAFEIPRRIAKIYAIPDQPGRLLAVQRRQEEMKQDDELLIIDLRQQKIVKASGKLPAAVQSAATNGARVWYALENRRCFNEVPMDNISGDAAVTDTKNSVNKLQLSRDGRVLQVLEQGCCEFFDITEDGAMLSGSVKLPGGISPDSGIPCGGSRELFVSVRRSDGILISGESVNRLVDRAEGPGVYIHGENKLFICSPVKNRIRRFTLPDCSEERPLEPGALKPSNGNGTFRLFARSGKPVELIQLDERGNIFKIYPTGRRGKKSVLSIVDRKGMK